MSDYVKAKMEVIEMPRPLTAGFKAVLHAIWLKQVDIKSANLADFETKMGIGWNKMNK